MSDQLHICIDSNEAASRRDIVNHFLLNGIEIDVKKLDICDYVVSDRVGVERKDSSDFLSSMKDGRLFDQAKGMAEVYDKPILVLEGGLKKAFKRSNIRPSSVYGALSSLALDYGICVMPTDCPESTGILIHRLAYREQVKENRPLQLRSLNRSLPLNQQQIFLLSGLPQIGTTLAEELLRTFETPQKVIQEFANAEIHISSTGKTKRLLGPLSEVRGIGPVIVENAQKLLNLSWNYLCSLELEN